jgi:hypothetical protein
MNIQKLIALADPSWAKDLADIGIVQGSIDGDELANELKRQADEERTGAIKQAATEILALGRKKEAFLTSLLQDLRRVRAEEKRILAVMKNVEAAWTFGNKSRNYIPVGLTIGEIAFFQVQGLDSALLKVQPLPEDQETSAA